MNAVRLLLIDNSIMFRDHLTDGLKDCLPTGSIIETANTPAEALEKIASFRPTFIGCSFSLSSVCIGSERFFSVLASKHASIPVIAYGFLPTGKATALREGVADYLVKPMDASMYIQFALEFEKSMERIADGNFKPKAEAAPAPPSAPQKNNELAPGAIMMRSAWKKNTGAPPARTPAQSSMQKAPTPAAQPAAPKKSIMEKTAIERLLERKEARENPMEFHDANKKIELITIGSSTGGTEALSTVLKMLRPPLPGIVITQHIPPLFAKLLAERLDKECVLKVKEGTDGEMVQPNTVYIAPGDKHMTIQKVNQHMKIKCSMGPKVHSCRPSVDVLFQSIATSVGASALGVILTGMGQDGAEGLLEMRKAGSPTLGQNEATCVVYGMPRVAWEIGAVEKQLALNDMAGEITRIAHRQA